MDKPKRPLGITALAFASIIVGIFCQVAAIALLLGGTLSGVVGTDMAVALLVVGALYLGLMGAAYFVGYGFWSQSHWSWAAGIVVYATLIVISVFMFVLSANIVSVIGPAVGGAAAIWYLLRPGTRAHLLGPSTARDPVAADPEAAAPTTSTMEAPQVAR
jgi:hypothetical protein